MNDKNPMELNCANEKDKLSDTIVEHTEFEDILTDVEGRVDDVEFDGEAFSADQALYQADKKQSYVNDKGEVVASHLLTPWQMIESFAKNAGVKIKDAPNPKCKKCDGRGWTAMDSTDPNTRTPIPCKCIFVEPPTGDQLPAKFNRDMKKRLEKLTRRQRLKTLEQIVKKENAKNGIFTKAELKKQAKKKAQKLARKKNRNK